MKTQYRRFFLSAVLVMLSAHALQAQNSSYNYIRTRTMLNEQASSYMTDIQYFDNLGRPSLHANNGVGMMGKYVYTLTTYNEAGHEMEQYQPAVGSTYSGNYYTQSGMNSLESVTYSGDSNAYSYTQYDMLGRIKSVLGPGNSWHSNHKYAVKYYGVNTSSSVKCYKAPGNTSSQVTQSGYYAEGTLHMEQTTDEDGHTMQVFTDRLGRKVLERRDGDNDTYYVYNTQGQLRFVLSPDYQQTGSLSLSAYEYRYDARGRVTIKILPQCEYTQYWYDRADRLMFMQDARLRQQGLYRFTFYDKLGRPAVQGTCSSGNFSSTYDATVSYSQGSNTLSGTNYVPAQSGAITNPTVESATYYDDYRFLSDGLFSASGQNTALTLSNPQNAGGLQTGHICRTTSGQLLYEVTYYDEKGQVIDHRRTLPDSRLLTEQSTLSFTGHPLTVTQHLTNGTTTNTVTLSNTYNAYNNRIVNTSLTYGSGSAVTVASYTYDDLGRLTANQHSGSAGTLSYTYNVRGWLTSVSCTGFSEELFYTDGPGTPCYNGNISSLRYTAGTETGYRGYHFSYDNLNRLVTANYGEQAALTTNSGRYTEQITSYSPNSAIKTLKRYGKMQNGSYGLIDDLTMTLSGNQLTRIADAATPVLYSGSFGFRDNTVITSGNEYGYDDCGAITWDSNKGIAKIDYDLFGMPKRIQFTNGHVTEHVYTADGEKLKTIHRTAVPNISVPLNSTLPLNSSNTLSVDSTEYIGDFVFEQGALNKYLFAGGYFMLSGSTPVYHYYTPDHLGNNRAVVNQSGTIEQVMHYYPFGGIIADISTGQDIQKYKYNGKELDRMHGLDWYDYGARHYDAAIGSWPTMDPLAEKYYNLSPYNYCGNNPVKFIDPDGMRIYVEEESREQVLEWINALSKDQYKIDDSGFLYLAGSTSEKYHSQYYSDRLNAAISSDNTINIHIGNSLKGRSLSDIGEGATWCNPNGNAEVVISGNTVYSMRDESGNDLYDGPEYILAHELAGHAIPWIAPSIYNDNRDTGYAIDSENIIRKETKSELRGLSNYSLIDTSFPSSQGYDIPWKGNRTYKNTMQMRVFDSIMIRNLKRYRP